MQRCDASEFWRTPGHRSQAIPTAPGPTAAFETIRGSAGTALLRPQKNSNALLLGSSNQAGTTKYLVRIGIVLGNERDGIAEDLLSACTRRVRVPMRGFVESLNVSVSAAILLSAATRNRAGDLSRAEFMRVYARGLYFTVDRADEVLRDL